MKKMVCLLVVLVLCCSMVLPVFANAGEEFVPSITYKDGPDVDDAILDDGGEKEGVDDCVEVTTIEQAKEKTTDITQEDRDLLIEVYEKLKDGSMTLPVEGDYVIWELFDLSFEHEDCRVIEEHGHKDQKLKEEDTTLTVTFDLGIDPAEKITVLVYVDGEWVVVEATNNGDGTLTCVFEDICPVVFCREKGASEQIPQTGDDFGKNLVLWVAVLVASAAAIVVLLINRRKVAR